MPVSVNIEIRIEKAHWSFASLPFMRFAIDRNEQKKGEKKKTAKFVGVQI